MIRLVSDIIGFNMIKYCKKNQFRSTIDLFDLQYLLLWALNFENRAIDGWQLDEFILSIYSEKSYSSVTCILLCRSTVRINSLRNLSINYFWQSIFIIFLISNQPKILAVQHERGPRKPKLRQPETASGTSSGASLGHVHQRQLTLNRVRHQHYSRQPYVNTGSSLSTSRPSLTGSGGGFNLPPTNSMRQQSIHSLNQCNNAAGQSILSRDSRNGVFINGRGSLMDPSLHYPILNMPSSGLNLPAHQEPYCNRKTSWSSTYWPIWSSSFERHRALIDFCSTPGKCSSQCKPELQFKWQWRWWKWRNHCRCWSRHWLMQSTEFDWLPRANDDI